MEESAMLPMAIWECDKEVPTNQLPTDEQEIEKIEEPIEEEVPAVKRVADSACDGLGEDTCNANPACNWCTCYAVPSRCWTMEESAMLPMAIWECDKEVPTNQLPTDEKEIEIIEEPIVEEVPAIIKVTDSACDDLGEDTCNANPACNWCTCYAVPSRCWTMEESAMLPMAIWECDKEVPTNQLPTDEKEIEIIEEPIVEEVPAIIKVTDSACDGLGDEDSCNSNDACNWCTCYAVPSRCWTMEESAMLPMAIWECDKNSQSQ